MNMNIQILRHMIPLPPQDREPSKTEVIWLAVDYITELSKMLESADAWQAELEMVDVHSLDSLDSLEESPLFNFEGKYFLGNVISATGWDVCVVQQMRPAIN